MSAPGAPGPSKSPELRPLTLQAAKEYLKGIIDVGEASARQLDEELRGAKTAKRNAVVEYNVCCCPPPSSPSPEEEETKKKNRKRKE